MSHTIKIIRIRYKNNKFMHGRKEVNLPEATKSLLIGKGHNSTCLINEKILV